MAKDKSAKAAAAKPAKSVDAVKNGRVTKPANSAKNVAKETAKQAAKNVEKGSKKSKKVKEPTPESSSDEEEEEEDDDEDTSDSSASSDSEDDEDEKPAAKKAVAAEESDSDDSDSSDDDDEEEEEKPKVNGHAKTNGAAAKDDDEDDDSEDDSEDDSDDSSDDDEEDEDEEEEKAAPVAGNKRKAEDSAAPSAKKTKYTIKGEEKEATANLFVGSLSWNVDDDWLAREFSECEGFGSARVMTERDSGRSRGFGYVEFDTAENAGAALEKLQGQEVDGRALNLDFSTPRTNNNSTPQQKSFDRAKSYGDVPKEPSNTLWVGNLSFDIDQDVLSEYFAEHGTINSVRLPTDKETGEFKGFGYVEMASVEEAQAAFDALQGADVAGRAMRLDFAGPRPERQDSFGGGRGGGRGRGGFGNSRGGRGGFGGGRGGDRGRGGRGGGRGGRGGSTNRGGFGDFSGKKTTF